MSLPKLYNEFAPWFQVLTPPEDYAEEAAFYWKLMLANSTGTPQSILELGSGGGHNALYLKKNAAMTLVDLSPAMLEMSRALNPECEHIQGDMRSVRLAREFDVVFIQDAISCMLTPQDLALALTSAFVHCRPGGMALFMPDYTRETFKPHTEHGGQDRGDKALRYLEWTWDPDPEDSTYAVDFAFLLRDAEGRVRCEYERHLGGLFSQTEWLQFIRAIGFEPYMIPLEHSQLEPGSHQVFLGLKGARY